MLASTRSKRAGARTAARAVAADEVDATRFSSAWRRAAGSASGIDVDADGDARAPRRAAATARMPLPVPTSSDAPEGPRRARQRLERGQAQARALVGARCRRRGPGSTTMTRRRRRRRSRTSQAGTMRKPPAVEGAEALAEARHPVDLGDARGLDARRRRAAQAPRAAGPRRPVVAAK